MRGARYQPPDDFDAVAVLAELRDGQRLNEWERACVEHAIERLEGERFDQAADRLGRPSARREP